MKRRKLPRRVEAYLGLSDQERQWCGREFKALLTQLKRKQRAARVKLARASDDRKRARLERKFGTLHMKRLKGESVFQAVGPRTE